DLHDGLARALQLRARFREPQTQVVSGRHRAEVLAKQPLELTPRYADEARDLVGRERIFDVRFHQQQRVIQTRMALTGRGHEWNALPLGARAQRADAKRIGDPLGKLLAVAARDHREHEVDARLAARAGRAIAIDLEDLLRDDRVLELLGELLVRLPVDAH